MEEEITAAAAQVTKNLEFLILRQQYILSSQFQFSGSNLLSISLQEISRGRASQEYTIWMLDVESLASSSHVPSTLIHETDIKSG